jgi:hypothetical protein
MRESRLYLTLFARGSAFQPIFSLGEQKAKMLCSVIMELKACKVTLYDTEGIEHSVHVTAGTLYEALAMALKLLGRADWVSNFQAEFGDIQVEVKSVPISHTVKLEVFRKWLAQQGTSPAEMMRRQRVRTILEIGPAGEFAHKYYDNRRGADRKPDRH